MTAQPENTLPAGLTDPTATAPHVAAIGSPSSNYSLTMNVLAGASQYPLVGRMLFTVNTVGDHEELALGTVTEVTTENQWHEDRAMRGLIRESGDLPNLSGDAGDIRTATVPMQACYKRPVTDSNGAWSQAGTSMSMSPSTGAPIRVATDELLTNLVANTPGVHYLGDLHGAPGVRLPFDLADFSGNDGARHGGVFGVSGAGKTGITCYMLGSYMRHADMGILMVDPQGQWAAESGLPFSVQGWAAELGRPVRVRRVSEDLRLGANAPLFASLLMMVEWPRQLGKMSGETAQIVTDETERILQGIGGEAWTTQESEALLDTIMEELRSPRVLQRIFATKDKRARLFDSITQILGTDPGHDSEGEPTHGIPYQFDPESSREAQRQVVLELFRPVHNLFQPTNPEGGARHSLWETLNEVFDPDHDGPRPYVVIDMSTREASAENADLYALLETEKVKAAILRSVFRDIKIVSESRFREGRTLNTLIGLDEAWRYAPPPRNASDPEVAALTTDLAGYARDTRKFGIGWFYITQTTRSLNPDIWDQLTYRAFGYGLAGPDVDKIAEILDDRSHLKLYRAFSPPTATEPRVYPWMLCGPVSPLSFSRAPLFVDAYTNFQSFRDDNDGWIRAARLALGKPVLSGDPDEPDLSATGRRPIRGNRDRLARRTVAALREARSRQNNPTTDPVTPGPDTPAVPDPQPDTGELVQPVQPGEDPFGGPWPAPPQASDTSRQGDPAVREGAGTGLLTGSGFESGLDSIDDDGPGATGTPPF